MPVAGRGGIASALVVGDRIFVIDCGRGAPSAFVDAGLDFRRLDTVFVTHLHADHVGDLPGMLLYPWGSAPVRTGHCHRFGSTVPAHPERCQAATTRFVRRRRSTLSGRLRGPTT